MSNRSQSANGLADYLVSVGITDKRVLEVIATTPREHFIPESLKHRAYENNALPIGQGQTISQPLTVATMTSQLLQSAQTKKVLEIGTGSGYQTAILAQLFDEVYSVERIKSLQFHAKRKLNQLNLHNVKMKHGDGWQGWSSKAPFNAVIVTAAAESLPVTLVNQLVDLGQLVIPLGAQRQKLISITKHGNKMLQREIGEAHFVPLIAGSLG